MVRRWGFVLPVGAQGSGMGSRAILKRLKNGTVVHDASYFIPIQLDGPEDSLLSILGIVLCPSPSDESPNMKHLKDKVMQGVCYENAMLCRAGIPHSQVIGPVTYMWRPFSRESSKSEAKEGDLSNSKTGFNEGSCSYLQRQLWIWIHPSALAEGLDAIRIACDKQSTERLRGGTTRSSRSCIWFRKMKPRWIKKYSDGKRNIEEWRKCMIAS